MRPLVCLAATLAAPAVACPDCPTAALTRAAVLDERFALHLALTLAPLVIIAAVCALLYRIGEARP